MSDLGPAIVTGSVAIVVAAAGFVSTGMQAARTHRAQDRAALRDEKRRAYADCLAALYSAREAEYRSRSTEAAHPPMPTLISESGRLIHPEVEEAQRAASRASTDLIVAIHALTLVAPESVVELAWKAAAVLNKPTEDATNYEAMIGLLGAMRADLGYQQLN